MPPKKKTTKKAVIKKTVVKKAARKAVKKTTKKVAKKANKKAVKKTLKSEAPAVMLEAKLQVEPVVEESTPTPVITHQDIEVAAFYVYENRQREGRWGNSYTDWVDAEAALKQAS